MSQVRLDPMTDDDFATYRRRVVGGYAEAHVQAGSWPADDALARAEEETASLLPDGLATPGQHLFTAWDGANAVGLIWFAERADSDGLVGFIYDVEVADEWRGKGYGEAIMRAVEEKVRDTGLTTIRLHVFGNNTVARSLYRKLDYAEIHVTMDKPLQP